jgi:hypothetical protein
MFVTMKFRLSVASLGVAVLASVFGPVPVLVGFVVLVACPVGYSAYLAGSDPIARHSLPPEE